MDASLSEIARSLDLPESTLDRWIRQGRIPVQRVGDTYRFNLSVLERWAEAHDMTFRLQATAPRAAGKTAANLLAAMQAGGVYAGVQGASAAAVLKAAVARLTMLPEDVRDELYDSLVLRERLTSTGLGRGVAIPHPRSPLSEAIRAPLIATCFLDQPVDYDAVDDQPVFVLFVLLSTSVDGHLQLLSRLAFCLRDARFVAFLQQHPPAEDLFARVATMERQLDKS